MPNVELLDALEQLSLDSAFIKLQGKSKATLASIPMSTSVDEANTLMSELQGTTTFAPHQPKVRPAMHNVELLDALEQLSLDSAFIKLQGKSKATLASIPMSTSVDEANTLMSELQGTTT